MSPELLRVIERATRGLSSEPAEERRAIWKGITEITSEAEPLGQLARASHLCVSNEIRLQADFLDLLRTPINSAQETR